MQDLASCYRNIQNLSLHDVLLIMRCDLGNINATVQYEADDMSEGSPRMMIIIFLVS